MNHKLCFNAFASHAINQRDDHRVDRCADQEADHFADREE
jgi:hypothetical protein